MTHAALWKRTVSLRMVEMKETVLALFWTRVVFCFGIPARKLNDSWKAEGRAFGISLVDVQALVFGWLERRWWSVGLRHWALRIRE